MPDRTQTLVLRRPARRNKSGAPPEIREAAEGRRQAQEAEREAAENARAVGEGTRLEAEDARDELVDSVRETVERLEATLERMTIVEDMRRTLARGWLLDAGTPVREGEADIMEYAVRTLPDVSDARGTFQARALARESADGRWEAWLEFVPADGDTSCVHATPIETHQRDRVTAERWMSGLTRVYAEGALARAVMSCPDDFRQLLLPELGDALR